MTMAKIRQGRIAIEGALLLSVLALGACAEGGSEQPSTPARGDASEQLPDGSTGNEDSAIPGPDGAADATAVDETGDAIASETAADGGAETCGPTCSLGVTNCDGNAVRTCESIGGCNTFGAPVPCPGGTVCNGGKCAATCTNACPKAGDVQCSGSGAVQTCGMQASGCLDWSAPVACPAGNVCSGGTCAASCTNQCTAGAAKCAGADSVQTCAKQPSGCDDWSPAALCPGAGACTGAGVCVACVENSTRCGATGGIEECKGAKWVATSSCPLGCAAGKCVASVSCTAGAYRCNGLGVEVCNTTGSAWLNVSTCAVACSNGLCTGACTPDAKRCNANRVETCNAAGTAWTTSETCAKGCDASTAKCALASLTISTNTDLDGEIVVDGPVVVKAGAKLNSPKGDLTIRATSIEVEKDGSITAAATGAARAGGACNWEYCNFNRYIGASGRGGTAVGTDFDWVVGPGAGGADGGSCHGQPATAGGTGGGVIRLIATTVTIKGSVTADGTSGAPGISSNGGGGGGAGGGILLAAQDVVVSGVLSAAGGQGGAGPLCNTGTAGEAGRVRILYGASRSITGSITGRRTEGLLPPIRISSSTHPDSSLWYNDDFADVVIAWEKPWASRLGYYWDVGTTFPKVPAPGSGTWLDGDVLGIDRARFVAGSNYFQIASVDATSNVGKVAGWFLVKVNTTPPTVTSTSHPNQTAWSSTRDAFFAWNAPNGDENYKGYHWVLDRFGDTVPTLSDTFAPITQKQIIRPALADGIWAFHLVTEDTRGYLTKTAAHYRFRVGEDPGTGGLLGKVVDKDSKNVAGARVTINRGLLVGAIPDQTTNSDGSFNFGNVPVGTWEVSVSKAGSPTVRQTVTVTKGTPTTQNMTL
jgi:hypothetical protein